MRYLHEMRFEGQCNCENSKCDHGENSCPNKAGKRKAQYVGALCDDCADKMPKKYMIESLLWEQEDPKIEELQAKEEDSVVKQKRNAIKRLAKQKGYKLSYWQTANRNARTVYTTYGVFPRDEKRPVSFEGCEFTKGFTGSAGSTSTTRGSEYRALDEIEKWLNDHEDLKDSNSLKGGDRVIITDKYSHNQGKEGTFIEYIEGADRPFKIMIDGGRYPQFYISSDFRIIDGSESNLKEDENMFENKPEQQGRWIVLGAMETHDYNAIKSEYDLYKDDPDVDLFDFTDEVPRYKMPDGTQKTFITLWGKEKGFEFIEDNSHPFGGYFDVGGKSFMGAAASPDFIIMIPRSDTEEVVSESRKRIQNLLRETSNMVEKKKLEANS